MCAWFGAITSRGGHIDQTTQDILHYLQHQNIIIAEFVDLYEAAPAKVRRSIRYHLYGWEDEGKQIEITEKKHGNVVCRAIERVPGDLNVLWMHSVKHLIRIEQDLVKLEKGLQVGSSHAAA